MREQYSYSEAAIPEHIFIEPAPSAAAPIQKARQKRKDRGASSRSRIILYQRQANSASAKFESISVFCRRHNGYIPVPYQITISERLFRQNAGAVYLFCQTAYQNTFPAYQILQSRLFCKRYTRSSRKYIPISILYQSRQHRCGCCRALVDC